MIKEIKELKKQLDNNFSVQKRNDDGRVIVDLTITNDDQFLSPYSTDKHSVISSDVAEFIENSLEMVPVNDRINFHIHSDVIDEKEKKEYKEAISTYYTERYKVTRAENRRLKGIALIMALVAVFTLTVMIWLELSGLKNAVFLEVVDIFAWVFMWEAVDIFFLRCSALRIKEKRYLSLIDSKIDFLPIKIKS